MTGYDLIFRRDGEDGRAGGGIAVFAAQVYLQSLCTSNPQLITRALGTLYTVRNALFYWAAGIVRQSLAKLQRLVFSVPTFCD